MIQCSQMLDEAMSIGQKELDFLIAGDVFEAEKLAFSREKILEKILKEVSRDTLNELLDKFNTLKSLHETITAEAKQLHQSLKHDLTSMKKQTRRIAGYSVGSGNISKLAKERFISKKS